MRRSEKCLKCGKAWLWKPRGHPWPTPHICDPGLPRRLRVECPVCGAQPGTPCMSTVTGAEMIEVHQQRITEAKAAQLAMAAA